MSKGDELELRLIQESALRPEAEEEAKASLLRRIYEVVEKSYTGKAPNGGLLASLPDCVKKYVSGEERTPCRDDLKFTYNAIRVMMSRYMSKNEYGLFVETPSMVLARVALGFSKRVNSEKLYELLVNGKFMFNSPTLFNMYADGAKGTLSACYVTPVYDSMRAIMDAAVVQAMTFKWGGGQGFSFSELRPRWDSVRGTSSYSSGPMSFMKLYDVVTELVKQGGKRRGANMGIMHVWHPDIYNPDFDPYVALRNALPPQIKELIDVFRKLVTELEEEGYSVNEKLKKFVEALSREGYWTVEDAGFIQAKKPPLHDFNLTNFNISVGVNDAFMEAVLKGEKWWMVNPKMSDEGDGVYRLHYSVSRATGLGVLGSLLEKNPKLLENPYLNIFEDVLEKARTRALKELEEWSKSWGCTPSVDSKNTFAWRIEARILWEEIVKTAWEGGDPGVVFFDNHNKWNPTPWLGVLNATNPCSEQVLYPFENCNLGSVNLAKYIENGRFKIREFYEDLKVTVEAMDATIDLNNHPDERHYLVNTFTRKIGIGVMGLADALAKLNIPYDSDEAVAFTLVALAALEVFAWKNSWELGAKLGHAPAFECLMFDWSKLKCVEKEEPEKLAELLTPALLKAANVVKTEDEWLKVKYHSVSLSQDLHERLVGIARQRVEPNGSVKLIPISVLEKVLREVFGIDKELSERAISLDPSEVAENPEVLIALAVFKPELAWKVLVEHGRKLGARAPRNTVVTTIAPTGTVSIIAGCSSGIEPYFALVYKRQVTVGTFLEISREFRKDLLDVAKAEGLSEEIVTKIYDVVRKNKGSLRFALPEALEVLRTSGAPESALEALRRLAEKYATAMDIDVWYHLAHQIAAQLYVDQSISKTVNLPKDAPIDAVHTAFLTAWLGGLKGVTVYRDESKSSQVIVFGGEQEAKKAKVLVKQKKYTSPLRIATVKKEMSVEEVKLDKKLAELYEVKEEGEVVVLQHENSTCKTCER
ncbi:MAG: adenosylcobalamin-dependent ribonucleoside-diphosphate reductase [Acidilobaceae archaeon]